MNTDKTSLESETANGTKPVLCEVAVLSAYRQKFDEWVKENQNQMKNIFVL